MPRRAPPVMTPRCPIAQGRSFAALSIAVNQRYSALCIGLRRAPSPLAAHRGMTPSLLPYILLGACLPFPLHLVKTPPGGPGRW